MKLAAIQESAESGQAKNERWIKSNKKKKKKGYKRRVFFQYSISDGKRRRNMRLTHRYQTVFRRPLPHANPVPMIIISPVLAVFRLRQTQRLRSAIRRHKNKKDVAMLAGFFGRPWWLVRHDLLQAGQLDVRAGGCRVRPGDGDSGGYPVAKLGPLGVLTRRGVRVRDGDGVCRVGKRSAGSGGGARPGQADGRCVLELLGLQGVAQRGVVVGRPLDIDEKGRKESIDDLGRGQFAFIGQLRLGAPSSHVHHQEEDD